MKYQKYHRPVVYGGYNNAEKIAARLRAFDEEGQRAVHAPDSVNQQGP